MENKHIISCPDCGHKSRIPSNKHIRFNCPNCSKELEFDGRIKKTSKIKPLIIFVIAAFGFTYLYKYLDEIKIFPFSNKDSKKIEISANQNEIFLKKIVKAVDVTNDITNDFALKLASKYPGNYNINQICGIYDYLIREWKYVNDPSGYENFRSASRTIKNNLSGDCDDFAILMAALIDAIGGQTRINVAIETKTYKGHAFTEVYVAKNEKEFKSVIQGLNTIYKNEIYQINYTKDNDGYWLNLDWFGNPQHPGGEYFNYTKRTVFYPRAKKPFYKEL